MNNVVIMGRLTDTPELKKTQNDLSVISFAVAVNRDYSKDKIADFIDVVAWRQTAEFISKYFQKGNMIAIEGSIQTRNYEDKQGNKRKAVEVIARQVHFCGSNNTKNNKNEAVEYGELEFEEIDTPDDQLPF